MSKMSQFRKRTRLGWVKRGARVLTYWSPSDIRVGTVMSADNYIKVRLDGEKSGQFYHRSDVKPVSEAAKLWREEA